MYSYAINNLRMSVCMRKTNKTLVVFYLDTVFMNDEAIKDMLEGCEGDTAQHEPFEP